METSNIIIELLPKREREFMHKASKLIKKAGLILASRESFMKEEHCTDKSGRTVNYNVPMVRLTFSGVLEFKIKGFSYLGSLTADGQAIVYYTHREDTQIKDIVEKSVNFKCYHCGKVDSRRKSRLIFKKDDTGEVVSFGSKCSQDYFGIDVEQKLKIASYIREIDEFGSEERDYYGGYIRDNEYEHQLMVSLAIRWFLNGRLYVSQKMAEQDNLKTSTANRIQFAMSPSYKDGKGNIVNPMDEFLNENPADPEVINTHFDAIIKTYQDMVPTNDFETNLKEQITSIGSKTGILVYAVFKYFSDLEKAEADKYTKIIPKEAYQHYMGKVVENEVVTVKVQKLYDSPYGTGEGLLTIMENDKYCFVCFGKFPKVEKGTEVRIVRATLKSNEERDGKKQNIINRVKVDIVREPTVAQ